MIATEAIDRERRSEDAIREAVESAGGRILAGGQVFCPFHENTNTPAGSIHEDDGGIWKYKCHNPACGFQGDVWDVVARRDGRTLAEVLPKNRQEAASLAPQSTQKPKEAFPDIEALKARLRGVKSVFQYANPDTRQPELVVFRLESTGKKEFKQASKGPNGWVMAAPPKPWPIYNRSRIRNSPGVIVVEGEKCVHALAVIGFVATTSPCGAGKAEYADWKPLAGKQVWLWPDNDDPGRKHMADVRRMLEALEPRPMIRLIDIDDLDLPPKGDACDFLDSIAEMGVDVQQKNIQSLLDTAKGIGASADVNSHILAIVQGKKEAIPWPWLNLTRSSKALMPGTVTLIHGQAGATKSFFLLQAFAYWHSIGIKIALYELEDDRTYHLMRALAQRAKNSGLTDMEWVKSNPLSSFRDQEEHAEFLDSFGACIYDAPDKELSYTECLVWIEDRCKAGCRIIGIDPYTAIAQTEKPWVQDAKFVYAAKTLMRAYGASLIVATHPTKAKDGIAGGAAWTRFTQTIMQVEFEPDRKDVQVIDSGGSMTVKANRTIRLEKARNGIGTGRAIAFDFSSETLEFVELGIVTRKK